MSVNIYDSSTGTLTRVDKDPAVNALKETLTNEVTTRATLGAHNLFDNNEIAEGSTGIISAQSTSTGIRVYMSAASTGNLVRYSSIKLEKNTDYVLTTDVTNTVGANKISVRGGILGSSTLIKDVAYSTSNRTITLSFNSGNYDSWIIQFWASDVSAQGDVTYSNLLLRLASDPDTTYRPYAAPNKDLLSYKDNGVLGAKNFAPVTIERLKKLNTKGTWSENAYTLNGTTFTVNLDLQGNVKSIKVNATSATTGYADFVYIDYNVDNNYPIPKGSYILSKGNSESTVQCFINAYNAGKAFVSQLVNITNKAESDAFSIDYSNYVNFSAGICVPSGSTPSNVMVYPMIRLASDTDPTYQPYAMTNKELTEKLPIFTEIEVSGTTNENGLLGLSSFIPKYTYPIFTKGTPQICNFFNGSATPTTWAPYVRITDYSGAAVASTAVSFTVVCIKRPE